MDDDGRDEVPGLPVGGWVGAGDGSDVDADTPIAEPACPSCGRPVGPDLCRCDPWRDESEGPVG